MILTGHLAATTDDPATVATKLGRARGPALPGQPPRSVPLKPGTAATRLVRVLDDLGFQPELLVAGSGDRIRLRRCLFLDLVDSHAEAICALHLGLMQGVLAAMPASITVDRLEPFTEPDVFTAFLLPPGNVMPGLVGSARIEPSANGRRLAAGALRTGQSRSSAAIGATGRPR